MPSIEVFEPFSQLQHRLSDSLRILSVRNLNLPLQFTNSSLTRYEDMTLKTWSEIILIEKPRSFGMRHFLSKRHKKTTNLLLTAIRKVGNKSLPLTLKSQIPSSIVIYYTWRWNGRKLLTLTIMMGSNFSRMFEDLSFAFSERNGEELALYNYGKRQWISVQTESIPHLIRFFPAVMVTGSGSSLLNVPTKHMPSATVLYPRVWAPSTFRPRPS